MRKNPHRLWVIALVLSPAFCCGDVLDSPYLDYAMLRPVCRRVLYDNDGKTLPVTDDSRFELCITPNLQDDAEQFATRIRELGIVTRPLTITPDASLKEHSPFSALFRTTTSWQGPTHSPVPPDHPEGYGLRIGSEGIALCATDRRGGFYGLQTILQMLILSRQNRQSLPSALIVDWPDVPNRGLLLTLSSLRRDSDMTYLMRLLSVLANLKYNNLFFQFDYALPGPLYAFPARTGKGKHPLTDQQVRALCEHARQLHMDVNLAFQFGGHCTWLLHEPAYKTYGEAPPSRLAWDNTNWSPANPDLWKIVDDLVSHQIKVCTPSRVHVAHDEMAYGHFNTSASSKKAGLSNEELVALSFNKLRAIIPRTIEMLTWFDVFMPDELKTGSNRTFVNSDKMMELTPPDLVQSIWDYAGSPKHVPTVEYMRKHNRKYWMATFKAPTVSRVCYYADRYKAEGVIGTHWFEASTRWNDPRQMSSLAIESIVALGAFSWNTGATDNFISQDTVHFFRALVDGPEPAHHDTVLADLDISAVANFPTPELSKAFLPLNRFLQHVPKGDIASRIPFRTDGRMILLSGRSDEKPALPASVTIPVGKHVHAVHFLHACNKPAVDAGMGSWNRARSQPTIGAYRLTFEDSDKHETLPLKYRWNIQDWNNRFGSYDSSIAWSAGTQEGIRLQLQRYSWRTDAGRFLKSIEFSSTSALGMNPMLLRITLETASTNGSDSTTHKADGVVVWREGFEYDTAEALQARWAGKHGVDFDRPGLNTTLFAKGKAALSFALPAAHSRVRRNIGMQTMTLDVSRANKLSFRMRTKKPADTAAGFLNSLYLGKTGQYWYRYGFSIPHDGKWKTIVFPLNRAHTEGKVPKEDGMANLDTLMFSIWHKNKEPVEILIDDLVFQRTFDTETFDTVR